MKALFTSRTSQIQRHFKEHAQAITEFAIVLPILLMLLVGILEVGRMVFIYAAVNNASRDAARYASAVGLNDSGTIERYKDCAGIRNVASHSAIFVSVTTTIAYDHGPGTSGFSTCTGTVYTGIAITTGGSNPDRATVTVSANYAPMVRLIPTGSRPFTSTSSRTIFGVVALSPASTPTVAGGGGGGGSTPTPTSPSATVAPSSTPTAIATFTATPGQVFTLTSISSPTITLLPPKTSTGTLPAATATKTPINTPTGTPTVTATSACSAPLASQVNVSNSTMSTVITNPNTFAITLTKVDGTWNATTGGSGGKTLTLNTITLAGVQLWSGNNSTGSISINPASTISGNGTPTLAFTFNRNYRTVTNTSVTLTFSAAGCGTYTVTTTP